MMLENKKIQFLNKYNPGSDIKVAVSKSISAAVQHNLLYLKGLSLIDRKEVRNFWGLQLKRLAVSHKKTASLELYEDQIIELKNIMNSRYGNYFKSGHKEGSEFRISHSQKSLSVYLKHLWCMGLIQEPVACPVDRIILGKTKAKNKNDLSWGYVNSLDEHKRKYQFILDSSSAEGLKPATWELIVF